MAENNIIIKITGEADLDAAQRQLKALIEESEKYERQIEESKEKEKQVSASLRQSIKNRKELADVLIEVHRQYSNQRKALKDNITANKQSIKALTDQVKAYKTMHGQSGRMVQQLRAMREALQQMEDAGEFGSQAFIDLSIAAGKLEDQIGDTQQRIRVLASDTKELDAMMGLGDGLAGAFYVATSAAELFGDDMEGLQKAFYKVQAAMSVFNGVTQIFNALNKDSAAMVVLNTAVTKIFNKTKAQSAAVTTADAAATGADTAAKGAEAAATTAAATAQWSLNAAMAANPVGVVLAGLAALAGAIFALYKMLNKSEQAARRANKAQKEYDKVNRVTTLNLNTYAKEHDKAMQKIERSEADQLYEAKKRHASNLEMSDIELGILKQRQKETLEYTNKAIAANNKAQIAANDVYQKRLAQLQATRQGTDAYQEALDKLNDAERQMHEVWVTGNELIEERNAANDAVRDKELEIAELEIELAQQVKEAQIDLMREGQAKEIAQIKANYSERLRTITGQSKKEKELRKALIEKQNQEIADVQRKYEQQEQQALTDIDVKAAEERTKRLKGSEGVAKQLKVWGDYFRARRYQIDENARLEAEEVQRSTDSEEVKAAKIEQIEQRRQIAQTELAKEYAQKRLDIESQYIVDLEIAAEKAATAAERSQGTGGRMVALKENLDAQTALYNAQLDHLKNQYNAGLISYQEYKQQEYNIMKAITDAEVDYQTQALQSIADGFSTALGYMQQASDLVFEALSVGIQAEMDELEEMYTTDWEEAQKSADKKYISEKEYEKKKAALEEKQAKYAKAQALTNIAIQTALAIITTLAQLGATPWGIAASAIAGAMGAAQLAIAAAKPLAQYEKGRKGGKGEYAVVGEKGAEIMYIPQGASIIPHAKIDKPETWHEYNMPRIDIPELPSISAETSQFITTTTYDRFALDYDRMGESIAKHLPKQRGVVVNVDRNGVHVLNGRDNHTYLNTKYTGAWQ